MKANALSIRFVGILYLVVMATAFFPQLMMIEVVRPGDAAATASLVRASKGLLRLSIVSDLVSLAAYMGITVIFYGLFKPVSQRLSLLAAVFSFAAGTVLLVNELNRIAPLLLLDETTSEYAFDVSQRQAFALHFYALSAQGILIGQFFSGLHFAVIGWLVLRSKLYPYFVGALLVLAGVSYLASSSLGVIGPELLAHYGGLAVLPGFGIGDTVVFLWGVWLVAVGLDESRLAHE